MIEIYGDLWEHYRLPGTILLITSCMSVNKKGLATMARGTSAQCKHKWPIMRSKLGAFLIPRRPIAGQPPIFPVPDIFRLTSYLYVFPTKYIWSFEADRTLIRDMAEKLSSIALANPQVTFVLPRPGCGHGGLLWRDVKPLIARRLPNNVHVICKKEPM